MCVVGGYVEDGSMAGREPDTGRGSHSGELTAPEGDGRAQNGAAYPAWHKETLNPAPA